MCSSCNRVEGEHPKRKNQRKGRWVSFNKCPIWFWSLCLPICNYQDVSTFFKCSACRDIHEKWVAIMQQEWSDLKGGLCVVK